MVNIDKETQRQIQELQILEQNLQNILMQKQALDLELSEIENASEEIKKSDEEVYKLVGQIMVKSKKADIQKEMSERKDILLLRTKSLDNQEKELGKKAEELREKVLNKIQE